MSLILSFATSARSDHSARIAVRCGALVASALLMTVAACSNNSNGNPTGMDSAVGPIGGNDAAPRDATAAGGNDTGPGSTPSDSGGTIGNQDAQAASDSGQPPADGATADGATTDGATPVPPACDARSAPAIRRLGLATVLQDTQLTSLVHAAQPPGSDDWYLTEITGRIWVWSNGSRRPTPFLDVSSELMNFNQGYDERGLLSIAFAPDYATSGKVYVPLIPTTGAAKDHDLILEYTRSAGDPFVLDPASRRAIVDLLPGGDHQGWNGYHNVSTVLFGPDGMLYAGMGDGGGDCNTARPGAPQDPSMPYGKFFRLDPKAPAPHGAAGNPFATGGDARVLHYGLRNPFRFSFDSMTGDLYIGDVGQWDFEEVSFAPAGAKGLNFGWPDFEAMSTDTCPTGAALRAGSTHTPPIHTIPHGADAGPAALVMTVVGGVVYRGSAVPALSGAYLFGEYYAPRPMGALYKCGAQTSPVVSIRKRCDANFPNDACFVPQQGAPALAVLGAIVEGHDKELYLAANGNALLKVVPAP